DEQQVATVDPPFGLDPGGSPGPRHKDRVHALGDDPQSLPGGDAKAKGVGGGRVGDSDHQVGAWQQAAKEPVAHTLAPHAGSAPGPGYEVVQRDHERARAAARQVEVDGVVDVGGGALDVVGQRDGVFVGRELAVAAAAAADDAIVADRQRRRG